MKGLLRCALGPLRAGPLILDQNASRYLVRVHRLREGDRFIAFDPGERLEAVATLTSSDPKAATCNLAVPTPAGLVSKLPVTLIQAIGKGDKAERVVRDATQLGTLRVLLVQSERSVPQLKGKQDGRQQRYARIALEAARQCGRGDVPEVVGPVSLESALDATRGIGCKLAFHAEAERSLREVLSEPVRDGVAALIGPEGGLSDAELQRASESGFLLVRLGPFVLRTETAAVAALASIMSYAEE